VRARVSLASFAISLGAAIACTATAPNQDETAEAETGLASETQAAPDLGGPIPDLPAEDAGDCEALEQLVAELDPAAPGSSAAAIDEFIATYSYGEHGFPLVEDTRLCLVYRGDDADALAVAGDFNDWDPTLDPLTSPLPGFAYAIVELDAPATGLYKLVDPGQTFRADPLARRHGWDEFGEYSQIDAIPGRAHHERWPGFAEAAGDLAARELVVWLPPEALDARADAPLPVLYMHDGQNLFSPDALFGGWQVSATLDEAIAAKTLRPLVVVGIANAGAARIDEYTHVEDMIDGMLVGGRADAYADFLVDGVVPFIEARYPVATTADQKAVMGSSLGGLVSLYIGQRHREHFDHAASMSGTVAWGTLGLQNPTIGERYADAPPLDLRVYLDSGGDPGPGCPAGGSDNYCANLDFADTLRDLGWVDEHDLFYRWDPGAPHNELAWAARLLPALLDWFPGPP